MKITTYLKRNNISQREFCRRLGVSHNTVSNYIRGKNKPSKSMMQKMKEIIGSKSLELK